MIQVIIFNLVPIAHIQPRGHIGKMSNEKEYGSIINLWLGLEI
jgi:hypothetical protein